MADKLEDFHLPVATINKLIKESLSTNMKLSKEARTAIARAGAIFVLYMTENAAQFADLEKRKTLMGQDIISALGITDFEEFAEPLKQLLKEFQEEENKKKNKTKTSTKVQNKHMDLGGKEEEEGEAD